MLRYSKGSGKLFFVLLLLVVASIIFIGCPFGGSDDNNNGDPTDPSSVEPTPTPLPPGTILSESLKDGQTVGEYTDGEFTPEGIQFHGYFWHLRYSIPTTPRGYIEFSAKGFTPNELHRDSRINDDELKAYLVTMWSGDHAFDHDTNPFIFELFKYGHIPGRPDATDSLFFGVTSHGRFTDSRKRGFYVLSWDPNVTYRIRLEWGSGEARVYRDGQLVGPVSYRAEFEPSNHQIQIGANLNNVWPHRRKEAPQDLLISDVIIGTL